LRAALVRSAATAASWQRAGQASGDRAARAVALQQAHRPFEAGAKPRLARQLVAEDLVQSEKGIDQPFRIAPGAAAEAAQPFGQRIAEAQPAAGAVVSGRAADPGGDRERGAGRRTPGPQ